MKDTAVLDAFIWTKFGRISSIPNDSEGINFLLIHGGGGNLLLLDWAKKHSLRLRGRIQQQERAQGETFQTFETRYILDLAFDRCLKG